MKATRVRTRRELEAFIELSSYLAAQRDESEHFVPLFASDIRNWHTGHGWFAEPVELWLIEDDAGRPVARTICHRCPQLAARLTESEPAGDGNEQVLFFGALEAADRAALDKLIVFITKRARDLRVRRIFGPVSPLPNATGGLLVSGEDKPGFFDTVWNPEFYATAFRDARFAPWGPAHTWEVEVGAIPAPRATAVAAEEWAAKGLRRRPVSRWHMGAFARRLLPTLNSAFSALPYYTQISPAQLKGQMQGLSALMDPDLIVDVAAADDNEEAPSRCFALVIPDPLPVLQRHGGHLGPKALLDLLRDRRRLRDAVLIIQGTDPRWQGRGLLSLVIRDLNAALVAGGYRRLRVTFIAEDNPASAAVFERSGGRALHELSFVDLRLDAGEQG
ncbi:GNAT family N-acetyltransferase [Brevibacterium sp. GP-SGM9]|uniref:GNAT family N-acetyltransferase n=1 Tax=Brevibacterium sp. GP-SGM9 TaxID=3376990 RepID=UPI0039A6DA62